MLPQEWYKIIVQMLKSEGFVRVENIMSAFNISIETVRRHLNNLEKQGLIQKTCGVAMLDMSNFHVRMVVLGADAISIDKGVSDYNVDEAFMGKIVETVHRKWS